MISIENSLTINKCGFTFDLLNCYREWKNRSADASGGTMNHCIWNNSFITDIGIVPTVLSATSTWKLSPISYSIVPSLQNSDVK